MSGAATTKRRIELIIEMIGKQFSNPAEKPQRKMIAQKFKMAVKMYSKYNLILHQLWL